MKPILIAGLRANLRRWGSLAVVISLSVAFLTASLGVGDLVINRAVKDLEDRTSGASVVVTKIWGQETVDQVGSQARRVGAETFVLREGLMTLQAKDTDIDVLVTGVRPPTFGPQALSSGRLPEKPGEIALDESIMAKQGWTLGSSVESSWNAAPDAGPHLATIVGTLPARSSIVPSGLVPATVLTETTAGLGGTTDVLVSGASPSDFSLGDGPQVTTPQTLVDAERKDQSNRASVLPFLLFSIVALIVAMVVVSTTMSVLTARRVKELALLRLVGASASAVTRSVVAESVVLGAAASVVGIVLGIGILAGASTLLPGFQGVAFVPGLPWLLGSWAAGVVATLIGGLPAVSLARRVRPLDAVTHELERFERRGMRTAVRWLSLVVFVASTLGVFAAAREDSLLPAVLCGAVSALSLMPVFRWIAPAMAARLPRLFSRSTGARLSSGNITRSPGRAGATASALLIGVTLVTMMLTAISTGRQYAERSTLHDAPFDIVAELIDQPATDKNAAKNLEHPTTVPLKVSEEQLARVRDLPNVAAAEVLTPAWAAPAMADHPMQTIVYALPENIGSIARGDVTELKPRQIFGVSSEEESQILPATLKGTRSTITREPSVVSRESPLAVMTAETAREMGPQRLPNVPQAIVVKVSDTATLGDVTLVRSRAAAILGMNRSALTGGAAVRLQLEEMIHQLLLVTLGLMSMSIIIAIIGVSDSLSLSQMERVREISLLRALGMDRRGVGSIVTWESLALTGAALIVAVPMGIWYGWLGAVASVPSTSSDVELPVIDPLWLSGIVLVSLALAVAASLLPARRAQRVAPAEGLATE